MMESLTPRGVGGHDLPWSDLRYRFQDLNLLADLVRELVATAANTSRAIIGTF